MLWNILPYVIDLTELALLIGIILPFLLMFHSGYSVSVLLEISIAVLIVAVVYIYFKSWITAKLFESIFKKREHFLITGGSSGIGLAFAVEAVKRGHSVTILARNMERLDKAKEIISASLLQKSSKPQTILALQADVTWNHELLEGVVKKAIDQVGPITYLVNCAGTSVCYRFEETPQSEFQRMWNTNFMGSVNITQVVVKLMKERKEGHIIFVSSLAGLVGLYGYCAYSASKFALVGMAEALQMEVKPYNISVTVSFPPDTDTPGYAEEMKSKLTETHLLSESGGIFSPQDVAIKTLNDAMNERFMSSLGFEGWLVTTLCCGMTPVTSLFDLIIQVFGMGLCRILGSYHLKTFDKTIKQCVQKKIAEEEN